MLAAVIYGLFGLLTEVIFTGIYNFRKKFNANVSLLMFPVYTSSYYLMTTVFGEFLKKQPILLTYLLITIMIYVCEYSWGFIFDTFKIKPWHYTHKIKLLRKYFALHVNHRINLLYLPFWAIFAIVSWYYYLNIEIWLQKL